MISFNILYLAFPNANHILCIWHIVCKNAPKNLLKQMKLADVKSVQSMLWAFCLKEDEAIEG
jgi:hypothetical protein